MFLISFVRSVIEQPAVPALIVALGGWGFAAAWFAGRGDVGLLAAGTLVVLGYLADLAGRGNVRSNPVWARRLMEAGILTPAAIAIVVGGALIVFGLEYAPQPATPGGTVDPEVKGLATALIAAVTTFGTVMWVKGAEDADGSWLADRIKAEFQSQWKDCFGNDTLAAEALYAERFGDVSGWGWKARRERIDEIQASLAQASCPPT